MDRKTWKIVGTTVAIAIVVGGLGALAVMYSGAYNVAATAEHTPLVQWVLGTTQERSVKARGDNVPMAPPFDSSLVASGFEGYRAMCVECHGAPGVDPGVNGQGLNPSPPDLAEEASEMTDGELFWVTKNGIKFTGMPAFGPTHSDQDIWGLVAFMRELETMSPRQYEQLVAASEARRQNDGGESEGHVDAPGAPAHTH